jgi:hypothetical protein
MTYRPSLLALFQQHSGRLIDKWDNYFEIYERHLSRFRARPIRVLEIGVQHGGSLQLWKKYFGEEASIIGVDIDPRCKEFTEDGIDIEIGDQTDAEFLDRLISEYVDFEVVIDDGSHISTDQLATFDRVWPHVRDGGVYLVEDCHCSYFPDFGGGFRSPGSFIEFAKGTVDEMNALWSPGSNVLKPSRLTAELGSVTFYDSVVVFDKRLRARPPKRVTSGSLSFRMSAEAEAIVESAHVGSLGIKSESRSEDAACNAGGVHILR